MSLKKNLTSSLLLLFMLCFSAAAQEAYFEGSIQISESKVIEAYIQIDFRYPQRFQNSVTYMTPEDYEKYQNGVKAKKLTESLKSKEIEGFTLADGRVFKTVKYTDLLAEGMGMLPQKLCLQQLRKGTISIFKLYSKTSGKIPYALADVIFESKKNGDDILIDHIKTNFQLLSLKDGKGPKHILHTNMLTLIGDNVTVKSKYDLNHYGVQEFITADNPKATQTIYHEESLLKLVDEYNNEIAPVIAK